MNESRTSSMRAARVAIAAAGAVVAGGWFAKDELTEHKLPGLSFLDPILAPMNPEQRERLEELGYDLVRVGPYNFIHIGGGFELITQYGYTGTRHRNVSWMPEADLLISREEFGGESKECVVDKNSGSPGLWYDQIHWSDELDCAVGRIDGKLFMLATDTGDRLHETGYVEIRRIGERCFGRE